MCKLQRTAFARANAPARTRCGAPPDVRERFSELRYDAVSADR
jgi:hypothetical protein